jgi:hypothetical protein
MHSDGKKQSDEGAALFSAGDLRREVIQKCISIGISPQIARFQVPALVKEPKET